MKKTVVLGFFGSRLDAGLAAKRWDRWRPTLDICRHPDLIIDRLELFSDRRFARNVKKLSNDIASVSPETQIQVHDIALKDPWDFEIVYGALYDFARTYPFDLEHERYLIHVTTGTHVAQICLFLLTETRHFPGQLLQASPPKQGEDIGSFSIIDLDLSRYDQLASRFQVEVKDDQNFLKSGIDTRNEQFNFLIERIERVAMASTEPMLLMGPTGAGKSQLARRIFDLKARRRQVSGDFVEVNCATIRGDGAMSALFGHVRGSFTGAQKDRAGLLRTAHQGVLFLDEIGELGPDEQAMLLRAVEERRFLPVGTDKESSSDFQLIAGTNRDLAEEVQRGRFREDLLARINLWTFSLPGLAERREDVEPNLAYELDQWARRTGDRVTMNRAARTKFLKFATAGDAAWKGNFRDFNAAIVRMATLSSGGRINEAVVEEEIERLRQAWGQRRASAGEVELASVVDLGTLEELDVFDKLQLSQVIAICRRSRSLSDAGRRLFDVSRTRKNSVNDADRLRKYLARYGLSWDRVCGD